ncbi:hypothetical protein [Streptomyces sp. TRM68416]|uniref:hypothetical protein n=1 Tax=Streptomyces sp. TRM68416 TaxID=2758412 RepID=UPI001661B613|nr:hypothetical protein [Streptomyces sp. TRM68416]MBD0838766.1 hypothetical protein [Streptomyces sp. TRM68416]
MYEGVRICCRCQKGILPGEPYDTNTHDRASGPPLVLFVHKGSTCKRQPHQGAPLRSRAR